MRNRSVKILSAVLLTAYGLLAFSSDRVKLIEFSWSSPDTEFLRKHIETMEAGAPYDGIGINLKAVGMADGKAVKCGYDRISGSVPWKYEWFSKAVENLKNTRFRKFTDNFLRANLGGSSWTDDRYWKICCGNFALLARIAKETGIKGLAVDPEMYSTRLFTYDPKSGLTPEQAHTAARRRGKEFGRAVFGAFPEIRLFFLLGWMEAGGTVPGKSAGHSYELLRPFLNGLYEVMPETARFFDGCENASYHAANEADFCLLALLFHRNLKAGVEPGLRGKFDRTTRFTPGLYLDSFFRCGKKGKHDGTAAFVQALYGANEAACDYIWTWGERGAWWPVSDLEIDPRWKASFLWKERFPMLPEMIKLILNPAENCSVADNLKKIPLPNDDLRDGMKHWEFWSAAKSQGKITIRKNAVQIENLNFRSCIHRTVKLRSGKIYLLTARAETNMDGPGRLHLFVGWRKDNRWNNRGRHKIFEFSRAGKSSGYTAAGIFRVPEGSDASLQFGMTSQSAGEYVLFEGISLYQLD